MALGCGMNARGSTEVIVASIGLSLGVLNQVHDDRDDGDRDHASHATESALGLVKASDG
jgi:hypothetical protein